MNINIIAAISKNRVIGNKGQIPWNIKKDLKYFQKLTTQKNSAVLMGFNTWKSLSIFPNPLPNRGNIVSLNRISKRGISSEIFFLDNKMLFVDSNNRLLKFN